MYKTEDVNAVIQSIWDLEKAVEEINKENQRKCNLLYERKKELLRILTQNAKERLGIGELSLGEIYLKALRFVQEHCNLSHVIADTVVSSLENETRRRFSGQCDYEATATVLLEVTDLALIDRRATEEHQEFYSRLRREMFYVLDEKVNIDLSHLK